MERVQDFFKKPIHIVLSLAIVIVLFFAGFFVGRFATPSESYVTNIDNKDATTTNVDFAPFWSVWNVINEKYVPTNGTTTDRVSDQTRVYGAIEGMVASLGDPYTIFFPPAESKSFNDQISGNFEGIGVEIDVKNGVLTVIAPLKDTPAYRA